MRLFSRPPDDWQTVIEPELSGRARAVTAILRRVPLRFSPSRNVTQWTGIEAGDFAIWLNIEVHSHLCWASYETKNGRQMFRCGGCKSPLSGEPGGMQRWKFELEPLTFAPFEVEIEMPGLKCAACGRANSFEIRFAEDVASALRAAHAQIQ